MAFFFNDTATTENSMFSVTGSAWTGNTISLREVVVALLNLDNKCHGFSKADGE